MTANQIVKWSELGVDGWVLSLSVPLCSFSHLLVRSAAYAGYNIFSCFSD